MKYTRQPEGWKTGHPGIALLLALLAMFALSAAVLAQDDGIRFSGPEAIVPAASEAELASEEVLIPIGRDTYLASNAPNNNFGGETTLRMGMVPSSLGAMRPMLYFNVNAFVPANAHITRAEVHINLVSVAPPGDSGRIYAAHGINQSWSEFGATWNTMPSYGAEIGRGPISSSLGWHVTDVTGLAQQWFSNPGGNNGIILITDERPDQNFERAYTSKEAGSSFTPFLRVLYDDSQDTTPPTATITSPPSGSWVASDFVVKWQGNDPNNPDGSPGSGIRWYDAYYSTNGGNDWRIGRAQTTETQTNVTGASNQARLDFYVRARDNAGNEGPAPSGPGSTQSWVRVDAEPPDATVLPLPEYTASTSFTVSWADTREINESGIEYYDVQFRVDGGPWQQLVYRTTLSSTTVSGASNGQRYDFRARAVDKVGNVQDYPAAPQATTLIWLEPIGYVNPFNPPIYQKKAGPSPSDGFVVHWGAFTPPGVSVVNFDVRYRPPNSSTWIEWKTDTTMTSDKFNLALNDPDGAYIFQARAFGSDGVQGQFFDELQASIVVDRNGPFIEPRTFAPFVVDQTGGN